MTSCNDSDGYYPYNVNHVCVCMLADLYNYLRTYMQLYLQVYAYVYVYVYS